MVAFDPSMAATASDDTPLQLVPARKRVLADEVADVLRAVILDGRLAPEQQIREEQIAARMQVSRGPVREALARLEREGLVYKMPNRGTFVARLSLKDAEEVFSLRNALETLAAHYFVKNATPADLATLELIVSDMQRCADPGVSVREVTDLDIQFHECVVRGAHHRRLLEAWLNLREQCRVMLLARNVANQDYRQLMFSEHRAMLDASRTGDVTQMLDISVRHIRMMYARLMRMYEDTHGCNPPAGSGPAGGATF
jgi:DNA-binding GntR family transcriptional regulator